MKPEILEKLTSQTLNIVRARGSVTGVELALAVMQNMYPVTYPTETFLQMLETMVKQGAIVEVEYVLPDMKDRVKSVYFPAGTTVRLNANNRI